MREVALVCIVHREDTAPVDRAVPNVIFSYAGGGRRPPEGLPFLTARRSLGSHGEFFRPFATSVLHSLQRNTQYSTQSHRSGRLPSLMRAVPPLSLHFENSPRMRNWRDQTPCLHLQPARLASVAMLKTPIGKRGHKHTVLLPTSQTRLLRGRPHLSAGQQPGKRVCVPLSTPQH